jgi:hypothetical protein
MVAAYKKAIPFAMIVPFDQSALSTHNRKKQAAGRTMIRGTRWRNVAFLGDRCTSSFFGRPKKGDATAVTITNLV